MSGDVHETKYVFKEEDGILRYCDGNLSFSSASNQDDEYSYSKKKMSRDPMSHRIIEKRRRDRMNNCLADLSRLIPPEYLKKGRGRIEKTEIIEMAIKHIGHLQNVIATTRFNENSNSSIPSPPAPSSIISREPSSAPLHQPLTLKHYRMGYLECMSEAVHFLVEVQGYFANDSLCVQMINHLRKHCDKILNGNAYNFPKKQTGDLASSDTSGSPVNGMFNGSPPLGLTHSVGIASDDNQPNQSYPMDGYYSPKRYSDLCCNPLKGRPSEGCYPRYVESDGIDSENRSDSEPHPNVVVKCQRLEKKKEDSKTYYGDERTCSRDCESRNGLGEPESYDGIPVKEENGPSQLRDMLTSPTSLTVVTLNRGNTSPMSSASGLDTSSASGAKNKCSEIQDGDHSDIQQKQSPSGDVNQVIMYKFKNNIKQRFSKEKRENPECDSVGDQLPMKKQKPEVDCYKCEENSLMKERLSLLDRADTEDEEVFKLNNGNESEARKVGRFGAEIQNGHLSSRLNFGHRANEKGALKRWDDSSAGFHHPRRPWALSPTPSLSQYAFKPPNGRYPTEYPSVMNNSFNNLSFTTEDTAGPGVPIFALHAKGSFYIPLTLDQAKLAPFLTLLGLAKGSNDGVDEKKVLHPVTISVNFQSHLIR